MVEMLKQGQYVPMPVEEQVASIYSAVNGYLDDLDLGEVQAFERELLAYLRSQTTVLKDIVEAQQLTDEIKAALDKAITDFKQGFVAKGEGTASAAVTA